MTGNPAANPHSIIVCGHARFTVLTSRLIRMEWASDGQFEDRATFAFPTRYAEAPAFTADQSDAHVDLKTDALTLHYTADDQPFHADNLSISFDLNGRQVEWKPGILNLGNLRGTYRTLDQAAGAVSLPEGLLSRDGWSLYDDSGLPVWDVDGTWVEGRHDEHLQDWYFFGYGHDYKAALGEYTRFGGRVPLIPRYVLGGWWSRFWAYSDKDLMQLVQDFQSRDIPLDVLVVDMDWHTPDAWTGYTWNRNLFPDPDAFLRWVHEQGLYATFNLHPAQGVQKHEAVYPEFARLLGQDPELGAAVAFRPADKIFMQHYFERLHHPMEEQGVDFWWLDWQQGEVSDIKHLDPLPWLNHLHFRDSVRRGLRPMLYSRWGGLGNHRYPIGFSGDAYATWEALRFQAYFTPTASNVLYGWWSHDIGGHFGPTEPELYARWVQFGAVSPCLRLHSTKDPLAERRPWSFPEPVYETAKAAFQFRYRLLPYLYSVARQTTLTGLSLCSPMYYSYPESEDAYLAREQYFLGEQIIAAPVVRPADPATGLADVDVWLPEGTWIEYTTLERFTGNRWIRFKAGLNHIPLFIKAGAIIPLAPPLKHTRDFDGSHIILDVFPAADGAFELYEDDGITNDQQRGVYETTAIRSTIVDGTLTLQIDGAQGKCEALARQRVFEVHLRGIDAPGQITVNDQPVSATYDPAAHQAVFTLDTADRYQPLTLSVENVHPAADLEAKPAAEPFVHVVDYATFEDSREHLGAVIVVAPQKAPFDAEIEWTLQAGDGSTTQTTVLKGVTERQIVYSPFPDEGSLRAFRWQALVTVVWNGKFHQYPYTSNVAYPTVNRWKTAIYNPQDHDPVADGVNAARVTQTLKQTPNLKQPFGLILLEDEREQISSGEPLEANVSTTLTSASEQEATLHIQVVGEARCFLNGVELTVNAPARGDEGYFPMFFSWMSTDHLYFDVTLHSGANSLVIITRPKAAIGWWGVGTSVLNRSGESLLLNGDVP